MAIDRRTLLATTAGAAAMAMLHGPAFAQNRAFDALGTWQDSSARYHLGDSLGRLDVLLPGRGHDITLAPSGRTAVVFARRPGRFLIAVDLDTGQPEAEIWCPGDRHLYGHGVFAQDGSALFVPENAFETGEGRIAVLDPRDGYKHIDNMPSHDIGPHDIALWPGSDLLLVANGGIRTHPDREREKLNLATMKPSLVLLDPRDHGLVSRVAAPNDLHQLSLRHLDVAASGLAAVGGQWEGDDGIPVPMIATWDGSNALTFADELEPASLSLRGYVGQVAFDTSGAIVAATSPVGGTVATWDAANLEPLDMAQLTDVCGICASQKDRHFTVSTGLGQVRDVDGTTGDLLTVSNADDDLHRWDNHLVAWG